MSSLFGAAERISMPSAQAQQAVRTAEPVDQLSEQARKNRRRQASLLTKDWSKPKLGYGGMTGM